MFGKRVEKQGQPFGGAHEIRRRWHHARTVIREVKIWQLIVIFILLCFISATLLRLNNIQMLKLRDVVVAADGSGDTAALTAATTKLQAYVSTHMNTDLGRGVALQASYTRAVEAVINNETTTEIDQKSQIYQEAAKAECQQRFRGGVASFRNDYVQCVVEKVSALAPSANLDKKLPNANLYYINFASPPWSADFAGFSVFLTGAVLLIIFLRIVLDLIARFILKQRSKV